MLPFIVNFTYQIDEENNFNNNINKCNNDFNSKNRYN